jgi:hypothetical protein
MRDALCLFAIKSNPISLDLHDSSYSVTFTTGRLNVSASGGTCSARMSVRHHNIATTTNLLYLTGAVACGTNMYVLTSHSTT